QNGKSYMLKRSQPNNPASTTVHGGSLKWTSIANKMAANATSFVEWTELVQIGSYSAAAKMPTTDALMPINALLAKRFFRNISQKGRAPKISSTAGKKIANVAIRPPCQPAITV